MDTIMRERSSIAKPYFSPTPLYSLVPGKRLYNSRPVGVGKAMTIGAGFRCRDGVVLCADTQLTWEGWHKRRGSKITTVSDLQDRLFFLQADIIPAGRNLIGRLAKAAQAARPRRLSDLEDAFRAACQEFREEEERCPPLIVAVRASKRAALYEIGSDFRITPVDRAAYIGSGGGVIDRIDESYFSNKLSVLEATSVAIYVAKEAKDFGSDVGRSTQVVQIFDTGRWDMLQDAEVERVEKEYVQAQELLGRLLTAYRPLLQPDGKTFNDDLKRLGRHLRRAYRQRGHLMGKRAEEEAERDIEARENEET